MDRRAFEKFSKFFIDDRKKKTNSRRLGRNRHRRTPPRRCSRPNSQVFLFVPLLFSRCALRYDVRCSCKLKCFYRHVLSRMNHYEYATVSILLAFRDYRRARVMHMREAAHLYPNFSSKSFEVEAFLYLLFRSPSPKSEHTNTTKI